MPSYEVKTAAATTKYSVLLIYPEGDNEGGGETYFFHCEADTVENAAKQAVDDALVSNQWDAESNEGTASYAYEDFKVAGVFLGHLYDLWTGYAGNWPEKEVSSG